jgi:integrase
VKQHRKKEKNIFTEIDKRNGKAHMVVSKHWPDGERFRRRCPSLADARNLLARMNGAIATGTWKNLRSDLTEGPKKESTVDEFADVYYDKYCKVFNTRPDFKEHALKPIRRMLGRIKLGDLRRGDVLDFVAERSEEVSAATVNRSLAVLKNMLAYAVETEVLAVYPLTRFRNLPEDETALRVMSTLEYRNLVATTLQENLTIGVLVGVLGETGLRKTEGINLKWEFVNLDRRMLTVEASKNYKTRHVPLTQFAVELFDRLRKLPRVPHCFLRENGERWLDPRGPFHLARARLGLDWVGFHGFRHFRATEWVADGMPLEKVQGLLGHRDIATTQKYVHYVAEHAKDAVLQAEERQLARLKQATNGQQGTAGLETTNSNLKCRKEDSNLHPLARTRT